MKALSKLLCFKLETFALVVLKLNKKFNYFLVVQFSFNNFIKYFVSFLNVKISLLDLID